MPYDIQPGDIIEVRLNMTMNGQRLLNVCHYRNGPDIVPDAQAEMQLELANMFDGALGNVSAAYITSQSDALTLDYADMQVIYPLRRAYERFSIAVPCTNGGAPMPQNVQGSITKRSSFPGPSGHGRLEIPGMISGDAVEGKWGPAALAALSVIGGEWQRALNLGTFVDAAPAYIYHRANPSLSLQWETTTIQDTVRVARRRTVRLGE